MVHSTTRSRVCVPADLVRVSAAVVVAAALSVGAIFVPRAAFAQPPMLGAPPDPALAAQDVPDGPDTLFVTDFTKTNIDFQEILLGGPEKDDIPPIDEPVFVSVDEADAWLEPHEPVVLMDIGGDARAYPIQVMIWHEIVNDVVGGVPVAVTYCPLCNTAIAFLREYDGVVYDFGTSGLLRYSNLLMYDRQTESWWQQATGEAVIGELTGAMLTFAPESIISWGSFKEAFPEGRVLSRDDTGSDRNYGRNPYLGYDGFDQYPFLYDGPEVDERLLPMTHVLGLELAGEQVAYSYDMLGEEHAVNDEVGGEPVVILWQPGTVTPMEGETIADGRDIGAAAGFSRRLDEQLLTFEYRGHRIVDVETGSWWNVTGTAVDGPLAGRRLDRLPAVDYFWFSWVAFRPGTRVFGEETP